MKVTKNKRKKTTFQEETKWMVGKVFYTYPPKWFMTVIWNDFPRDPITCESHSRHFKNVFLYDLYHVSKVQSLPRFPHRLGMMFFHERKNHVIGDRSVKVFHTHIHFIMIRTTYLFFWWSSEIEQDEVEPLCPGIIQR